MFAESESREQLVTVGSILVREAVLAITIRQGVVGPITEGLARFREILVAPGGR